MIPNSPTSNTGNTQEGPSGPSSSGIAVVPIIALIAIAAGAAAIAARLGWHPLVTLLCIAAAIAGTWQILGRRLPSYAIPNGIEVLTEDPSAFSSVQAVPVGAATTRRAMLAPQAVESVEPFVPDSAETASELFDAEAGTEMFDGDEIAGTGTTPPDARTLTIADSIHPEDRISAEFAFGRFAVRAASRRGQRTVNGPQNRRDAVVVVKAGGGSHLVAIVGDGVPDAANSDHGAYWSARLVARAIDRQLRESRLDLDRALSEADAELRRMFERRFDSGTELRSIATKLIGIVAPVAGGPATAFRVGDGDVLATGRHGLITAFPDHADFSPANVFPRRLQAETTSLDLGAGAHALLVSDGLAHPLVTELSVARGFEANAGNAPGLGDFAALIEFDATAATDDRTAVGIWAS